MSPGKISKRVVADRLNWINKMIQEIKSLPIEDYDSFALDKRNSLAAESCLRRSLEALMYLGRHILAKGFSLGVSEYKEIASGLEEAGIFNEAKSAKFKTLGGCPRIVIFSQIEECEKNYRRHMVDIPRIIF